MKLTTALHDLYVVLLDYDVIKFPKVCYGPDGTTQSQVFFREEAEDLAKQLRARTPEHTYTVHKIKIGLAQI